MEKTYIVGVFNDEDSLIHALEKVKEEKYKIDDVYTPYPIHELTHILKIKTRFLLAAFLYGFVGAASVLTFLVYTAVIDWPLNYGGKPYNAFPSFILITLILTIFITTLSSLFTFSWRAKLWPGKKPKIFDIRATDDKFIVVFDNNDISDRSSLETILKDKGASEIYDKIEE